MERIQNKLLHYINDGHQFEYLDDLNRLYGYTSSQRKTTSYCDEACSASIHAFQISILLE